MSERSKSFSVNGTQLHVHEAGMGELVVLVHGTLGDYRTWRRQVETFSKTYHVIAYSRRQHYPNAPTSEEYSVEVHAKDLAELVKHFGKEPAHIVTASWGGNVAIQLALTHPSLVRTIVFAEPPTLPLLANDTAKKHLLDAFNNETWLHARAELLNDRFENGIRIFINGVLGSGAYESIPVRARRYLLDNSHEMKAEALAVNYIPNFTTDIISRIHHPALLLEGDRSPVLFHAILDILQSSLPISERHKVPNSSHGMHADNALVYNQLVLDFLTRH
jgi:non-heme chloroperoxidase